MRARVFPLGGYRIYPVVYLNQPRLKNYEPQTTNHEPTTIPHCLFPIAQYVYPLTQPPIISMDRLCITGGNPLRGHIHVAGAKNAALPLMAASLLTEDALTLSHVPYLSDITTMANLLVHLGVTFTIDGRKGNSIQTGRSFTMQANTDIHTRAPYDIVRKMRASVVVLGPLLARFGKATVSLPGGCAIGARPIDFHLNALRQMGAEIELENGYIHAHVEGGRLKGADITFPKPSVGASENTMMAASLADGTTILRNIAQEPEVDDLAHCLNAMGADITGIGTSVLTINGVERLHGAHHEVISDRIEAGTYAVAAAITGGELTLHNVQTRIMRSTLDALIQSGTQITEHDDNSITVTATRPIKPLTLTTTPHPGFPTDMQAQMTALLCLAEGQSHIIETIFENRFMHVSEHQRMGAKITTEGNRATIEGNSNQQLQGAEVMATDLRASVSLLLAGLAAKGTTTINRIYHLDRGYERIEEKLMLCGADIVRVR